MRYGICQWNLPVQGYKGCYELKNAGLDGMELNFTEELVENVREYLKAAAETGMIFPTIAMNNFGQKDYISEGSEENFEKQIGRALECAKVLGVKTLQIPAFGASDISNDAELAMAARNLRRACEMAEPYGVLIGTENPLDREANLKLFEMVGHPGFRFYFDNQNLWRMKGIPNKNVLEAMKDLIVEVHAKDSIVKDGVQQWLPLGEGDGEFATSMKFLKDIGYDGWIHLENDYQTDAAKDPEGFDYAAAIRKDVATLKISFS